MASWHLIIVNPVLGKASIMYGIDKNLFCSQELSKISSHIVPIDEESHIAKGFFVADVINYRDSLNINHDKEDFVNSMFIINALLTE